MKVSFVMTAYNKAAYIAEAIQSVIDQSYKDIELIIVDDGSTDSSFKVVQYYLGKDQRISYFFQENKGAAIAHNKGMEISTGDIILLADADDIQEPERAATYITALKKSDWAYSGYYYCTPQGKVWDVIPAKPMTKESIRSNNAIPGASIGITRNTYNKGLRYRDELRIDYDLGFIIDIYKAGLKYALIDIPTFRYRVLREGMSVGKRSEVEETTAKLLKEL